MPKELRVNVEFTHPETGELQPATLQSTWQPVLGECTVYVTFEDGNFVRGCGCSLSDAMDGL